MKNNNTAYGLYVRVGVDRLYDQDQSHAVISSAAFPMDASCSLKEGRTNVPVPSDFWAPVWPTLPILAAPLLGVLLVATECIEPACVPLVVGEIDSALGIGFQHPGVAQSELGVLLVVA